MVTWATLGIVGFGSELTRPLLWVPPAAAGSGWCSSRTSASAVRIRTNRRRRGGAARVGHWLAAPWRGALLRTFRLAPVRRYAQIMALKAPMFFVSLCAYYFAAPAFGISIPFGHMLTFLPVVFMVATLPITVSRFGTAQAAWILLFGGIAPVERLLAFSLAADLTFALTRALVGTILLPFAYRELVEPPRSRGSTCARTNPSVSVTCSAEADIHQEAYQNEVWSFSTGLGKGRRWWRRSAGRSGAGGGKPRHRLRVGG